MKKIYSISSVMLVAAMATAPAHAKWLRAETDSFIIYSEGEEKPLREFAANLQRFDSTLRVIFRVDYQGEDNRLPIYLLPTAADVGEMASGTRGSSIAGFYRHDRDGSFALSHREVDARHDRRQGTPEAQQVLFHEYTHHFMKRHLRAAFPAWFIEGFAEYHSTVDFDKEGRAELGKPVYSRAFGLFALPKIPAEKFLFEQPDAMRTSGQADVYYGRSWMLTHMLYQDVARNGQMGAYIGAINAGTDPKLAATQVFGDLAELDKGLNRYAKGKLSYSLTKNPIPVATNIIIAPLAADEDAVIKARLARLNAGGNDERATKARDVLRALVAAEPMNAEARYEYAAAEWDLDDDVRDGAAVRAALDKVLAAKPDHVRANVLLGRLLLHDLGDKGEDAPAAWAEARKPIQRANRADPLDPVPLFAYYSSFADEGVRPSAGAIQAIERAFEIAPENVEVRFTYAFLQANLGKFDSALALMKTIVFDPHGNGQGESMLKQLQAMRDAQAAGGAEVEEASVEDDGA